MYLQGMHFGVEGMTAQVLSQVGRSQSFEAWSIKAEDEKESELIIEKIQKFSLAIEAKRSMCNVQSQVVLYARTQAML